MEQVITIADTAHVIHHAIGIDGLIEYVRHHFLPSLRRAAR
jgi:hypothetical protein